MHELLYILRTVKHGKNSKTHNRTIKIIAESIH